MRILFFSIIASVILNAEIWDFVKEIDWEYMGDKTEFSIEPCACEYENIVSAGFKINLAEPVGVMEFTNTPWNVVSLNKKFDKSITRKQGSSRQDGDNRRYAHFVAMAPFGLLNFVQDYICFERFSSLSFLYWSEVIPTQTNDTMALFVQASKGPFSKVWFNNAVGMLASVPECVAAMFDKQSNSLHWVAGCAGITGNNTAFGNGRDSDPIVGSHAHALGVIDDLHFAGLLGVVSTPTFLYSPVKQIPNGTCKTGYLPIAPKTQYALNLAQPTTWDATIIGKPAYSWANFKNKPLSEDDNYFWLWANKTSCMGATKCQSMFTKTTNPGKQ